MIGSKFYHPDLVHPDDFGKPREKRRKIKCTLVGENVYLVYYTKPGSDKVYAMPTSIFYNRFNGFEKDLGD